MGEPEAAASDPRAALRGDPSVGRRLLGYAFNRTRDGARAEDVAQEAIKRMLEGKGFTRWDPSGKALLPHLFDIVDSIVGNENTRASRRREVASDPERDENKRDSDANIEARAVRAEEDDLTQRLADRVMARVEKDPVIPGMLAAEQEGIDGAAEQAERLGCTVKDIRRARERLAHHRGAVLDEARKNGELP
jgi:hypothetical protein